MLDLRILVSDMTPTETVTISHVAELLAHNGYDVTPSESGVLTVRELHSGITFQAALEGGVVYMTMSLMTVPERDITPAMMRKMLSGHNGITTSGFRLYETNDGRVRVTLNNFCKILDMGPEDHDDILGLAGYLLADAVEARDILQPAAAA
jgi:hypothetical protein